MQSATTRLSSTFIISRSQQSIKGMTSVLLRQFTHGRKRTYFTEYTKLFGKKSARVLDSVIPDLPDNLMNASQSFIEGLVNLDEDFVQSTSTRALKQVLVPQIQQLKANQVSIRTIDWTKEAPANAESQEDKAKEGAAEAVDRMIISPYVIFGQTMEERAPLQDPWNKVYPITSNRYIALNNGFNLKDIMNKQIFGFHCYMFNNTQGFEVTEGVVKSKYPPSELHLSFETNADNHEFFVSDFNHLITA